MTSSNLINCPLLQRVFDRLGKPAVTPWPTSNNPSSSGTQQTKLPVSEPVQSPVINQSSSMTQRNISQRNIPPPTKTITHPLATSKAQQTLMKLAMGQNSPGVALTESPRYDQSRGTERPRQDEQEKLKKWDSLQRQEVILQQRLELITEYGNLDLRGLELKKEFKELSGNHDIIIPKTLLEYDQMLQQMAPNDFNGRQQVEHMMRSLHLEQEKIRIKIRNMNQEYIQLEEQARIIQQKIMEKDHQLAALTVSNIIAEENQMAVAQLPVVQPLAIQTLVTQPPATQLLVTQPPVAQSVKVPRAIQSPATVSPAIQSPAIQSPATHSPAINSPATQFPAIPSPKTLTGVQKPPNVDAPKVVEPVASTSTDSLSPIIPAEWEIKMEEKQRELERRRKATKVSKFSF
jgi:hypothetical protein